MRFFLVVCSILAAVAQAKASELLVCGWDEVYILNVGAAGDGQKVFSWKAQDRPELPAAFKNKFRTTDDCKAVAGNRILITASSDGVALVDRASGRTRFWGLCANAHSADLLPGERIAVACSVRDPGGNRLAVFDAKTPEKEIYTTELHGGHGVVWDGQRKLMWALGDRELRAFSLRDWQSEEPSLHVEAVYPLPDGSGHELSVEGNSTLIVSTAHNVWRFDRDSRKFAPHAQLDGFGDVKSVSVEPSGGRVAFTVAERPNWWTSKIRFLNPEGSLVREGERLYKVRWIPGR